MATQTFSLDWNDVPAQKPILNKTEIIDFCGHFNQNTQELQDFLTRFDFDEWICMELGIDYVYGKIDKSGQVGSDAVEFLSIIATTFFSDEGELALQKYLGFDKKNFEYSKDDSFVTFSDCPLWMIQVSERSRYYSRGLFFMPAIFWKDATLTEDSYGYSKYTVKSSGNWWYNDSFGKNSMQNTYWKKRIGSWSPNFIDTREVIPFDYRELYFDAPLNRVLMYDFTPKEIVWYDLSQPEMRNTASAESCDSIVVTDEGYHIYTDKGVRITDKDLNEVAFSKTMLMNEFHDAGWDVVIDKKGVAIQKKEDAEAKRFKFSDLKLTSSKYQNNPKDLLIRSFDQNLLLFNNELTIVSPDFNITRHTPIKTFQKEIQPFLKNNSSFGPVSTLAFENKQWFFSSGLVFEMDSKQNISLLYDKLFELTGEACFYTAKEDKELGGTWLLGGLGRLVFVDSKLEKGYVFNTNPQDQCTDYQCHNLFFDKDQNLWFSLLGGKLYKIGRQELKNKLKTAVPFSEGKKQTIKQSDMENKSTRLTYKDEKSDKFWEVLQENESLFITYGKTGTDGQSLTKTFESESEAIKERDKLIKQKRGKGYE